ncbi:MAG: hypothetical protein ACOCWJ_01905 [Verrucomicrobiota bacterium]
MELEEEEKKDQEKEGIAEEGSMGGEELAEDALPTHDHLRPPLLRPASRRVVFQSGRLDGFPSHRYSPLGRHEYDLLEDRERDVLQVHVEDGLTRELPQRLRPGQTVVVYLPEYERRDLVLRARIIERLVHGSLEIKFNDRMIWRRSIPKRDLLLRALIPAVWLEDFENTLTIRNIGESTLIFDALWIEEAAPLRNALDFEVLGLERLPPKVRPFLMGRGEGGASVGKRLRSATRVHEFPAGEMRRLLESEQPLPDTIAVRWYVPGHRLGVARAEQYIDELLNQAVGYYETGGGYVALQNLSHPGILFNPFTGRPYPPTAGLRQLAMLIQGERRRLHVNATQEDSDSSPWSVAAVGVEHSADSASLMVVPRYFSGRCMLRMSVPWHGPTDVQIIREVIPENYNVLIPQNRLGGGKEYDRHMEMERRTVDIPLNGEKRGLFEIELEFMEAAFLRLCRKGGTFPRPEKGGEDLGPSPTFDSGAVRIADAPVGRFTQMQTYPPFSHTLRPLCACYNIDIREGTRGQVGEAEYVTPLNDKSFYLKVDPTKKNTAVGEGAILNVQRHRAARMGILSFWVYPHVEEGNPEVGSISWGGGAARPHLKLVFGTRTYDVHLTAGKWQRVECKLPDWGKHENKATYALLIVESGAADSGSGGHSITYEFNGIGGVSYPSGDVHSLRLPSRGDGDGDGTEVSVDLALFGVPGEKCAFWHQFDAEIAVESVKCLGSDERLNRPNHTYYEASQRLHVSDVRFPERAAADIEPLLERMPAAGRQRMENKGLTPVIIQIRMRR